MREPIVVILLLFSVLACGTVPDENEIAGGTFVGYTFSEQPVVDTAVELEADYELIFKAYDLGGDARFAVYARRKTSGDYFSGVIRLSIEDPEGNVFTHYHSTEGEAIDRPIMWSRRIAGVHRVSVGFQLGVNTYARASFEVPLIREPVSGFLVAGTSLGVLVLVVLAVALIRRRR